MSEAATDGAAAPSETDAQAQSVQGELDALIKEGTKTDLSGDIKKVVSYVQDQQTETFNRKFREDIDATVKIVAEKVPESAQKLFTPDIIEAFLIKEASDKPEVNKAFTQRGNDPAAWEKIRTELVKQFSKRFEDMPDPGITEDREAVIAASQSQGKPSEEEEMSLDQIRNLPKDKWQDLQKKHGVKPYGT